MEAKKLAQRLADARLYIDKIGKPEPHLSGSVGRLVGIGIQTEICHQERPSATNYWKDGHFDAALSLVVQKQFPQLAEAAIALMQLNYEQARIAEKESLLAQLAEIEALEAKAEA